MKMKFTEIDMNSYPRREHFEYFSRIPDPYFGVTVTVDVTRLVEFSRSRSASFNLCFIHAAALAANAVPELRRRIYDGRIVEYDICDTSHTEPAPDETYCYCTLRHGMPWDDYLPYAAEARRKAVSAPGIGEDEDPEGCFFVTSLPWLHYTELRLPTNDGFGSNPRIACGKYETDERGRLMLPVTVFANHALADGLHLGKFFANLNAEIEKL